MSVRSLVKLLRVSLLLLFVQFGFIVVAQAQIATSVTFRDE